MTNKPKRPRKPLQSLKITNRVKVSDNQQKLLTADENGSMGVFVRDGDEIKFVNDPNGRWRLINYPNEPTR